MKETLTSRTAVVETKIEGLTEKLDEVREDIKRVHDCLHKTRELILTEIKSLRAEETKAQQEQNLRILALEQWRWYIIGIATASGFAVKWLFGI